MANKHSMMVLLLLSLQLCLFFHSGSAQLSPNYYADTCPFVEQIVKDAVTQKVKETFSAVGATVRLLFHDCFVNGCDGSVLISSTPTNKAERDNQKNLLLNPDGFDTIVRVKAAIDSVPQCANKVSCADIIVMATRDAITLAGGPAYSVELGRLDGLVSTSDSVDGNLPPTTFNLDQLTGLFASKGLSQADMIALSGAHTEGLAHCSSFTDRLYNFPGTQTDPSLNKNYASFLMSKCPQNSFTDSTVFLDPVTPGTFDNQYYKNLQNGMGLLASDQVLYSDDRSQPLVNIWAADSNSFNQAFIDAITKMAQIDIKTGSQGNIRKNCLAFN